MRTLPKIQYQLEIHILRGKLSSMTAVQQRYFKGGTILSSRSSTHSSMRMVRCFISSIFGITSQTRDKTDVNTNAFVLIFSNDPSISLKSFGFNGCSSGVRILGVNHRYNMTAGFQAMGSIITTRPLERRTRLHDSVALAVSR